MLRISHLSDTQMRNFQRHAEFRESYKNLYNSLKDHEPDVIVIAGDIAHTKTQISPEFVQLCSEYFTNLANIAPTVIIPGNHDGNLQNLSRLDALTPVVSALNNPNIHYFKESGNYTVPGIGAIFSVFSCFDDESEWPTSRPETKLPVIGLYHGFVQGAVLQNGMTIEDDPHKVEDFLKMVDYLMLGDIHRMQILDHQYRSAYCGSYPQQGYGESTTKGYLIWEIESKDKHDVDFVELPNVCPYYTLELKDDLKIPDLRKVMQQKGRVRILSRQLTPFEKDSLRERVEELYDPVEVRFLDNASGHRQALRIESDGATIEDLSQLGVQEKLIRQFLKPYKLTKELVDKVLEINRQYNSAAKKQDDTLRNVQYRIKKLRYDNLCSYGEGNEIDFSKYRGTLGIFGKSGVGKSTLAVDAPSYAIYNKISKKVTKNDSLINENKDFCGASIEVEVDNKTFKIKRNTTVYTKSGKRKNKPVTQGKTDVDFRIVHPDGTEEDRNGEERGVTDGDEIRKIFGTYEDFVATSTAPQWQLLNFLNKGATERQKVIGRYFDIDIFDRKHRLAKDHLKGVKSNLKLLEGTNFEDVIQKYEAIATNISEELREINVALKESSKKKQEKENLIDKLRSQVKSVDAEQGLSLSVISAGANVAKAALIDQENKLENIRNDIEKKTAKIKKIEHYMSMLEIDKLTACLESFRENQAKLSKIQTEKNLTISQLEQANTKLKDLDKYVCIKNSDCCMLEEINKAKSHKELVQEKHDKLKDLEDALSEKDVNIEEIQKKINLYERSERELLVEKPALTHIQEKLETETNYIPMLKDSVEEWNKKREIFTNHENQLKKNEELENQIIEKKREKNILEKGIASLNDQVVKLTGEKSSAEAFLEKGKENKKQYDDLRAKYEAYDYFIRIMGKDGLSKTIIANNLEIINKQIKNILSSAVDFSVEFSNDGKEIYFKSPKSPKREIELCSGMENTIAALSIRAALVSVTTLPKSNLFVLDEVFGALDSEYMDAAVKILDYLKLLFDTVIVITHTDVLKDVVDHVIEIQRDERGYSIICE